MPSAHSRLEAVKAEAAGCRACPLWQTATQTVFGEGPATAELFFVAEQPGDVEDREGRPFVGPAGRVFDDALAEAGIARNKVYVTNAVKHFKWEGRGKRRIHKKPNAAELAACRPWLDAELEILSPRVLVALGATAAQALLGRSFRVTQQRGVPVESDLAPQVLATVHPSSILRAPDEAARREAYAGFVADLKVAASLLGG
jgi:DNA polymerase